MESLSENTTSSLSSSSSSSDDVIFDRDRHVLFLQMMLQVLPSEYQGQEINRLTLAYFVVSGLHLLRALDRVDKGAIIKWVLSLQARPRNDEDNFLDFMAPEVLNLYPMRMGHLASTYCAIAILKIVEFDFSEINSESLLTSMKNLQQDDGSFMPIQIGAETDVRFVYCAAAICSLLDNWSGMDREKAKSYIMNCQSFDGGFGLVPGSESHGGATYCAVASLRLMGFIEEDLVYKSPSSSIINFSLLLDWSLQRQASDGGFQGRPNKDSDTCYAFWIGGVLKILGGEKFIDEKALRRFLLTCQSKYGGFSKFPHQLPDLYHSYYGLSAFSMLGEPGMNPLCAELGLSVAAAWI